MYGKPVLPATGGHQSVGSENSPVHSRSCVSDGSEVNNICPGNSESVRVDSAERSTPRPLSPTKLLPFLSNLHRNPSDADLEALRRRLHHAPRPLKKRSSITEPEGPAGPNIQKLLYQKTTLAAMETISMETSLNSGTSTQPGLTEDGIGGTEPHSVCSDNTWPAFNQSLCKGPEDSPIPPPLPPRSAIPEHASCHTLLTALEEKEGEICPSTSLLQEHFSEEYPPYPPPPYPSSGNAEHGDDALSLQPPEVTGQETLLLVSICVSK